MSANGCPREAEILRAVRADGWTDDLRDHARGCPECADALLVAAWLAEPAGAGAPQPLPDPDLIWWKARLLARRDAVERATRPIAIVQKGAAVTAAAVAAVALGWAWPLLASVPRLLTSGFASQPAAAIAVPTTLWGIVLVISLGFLPIGIALSVLTTLRAGR